MVKQVNNDKLSELTGIISETISQSIADSKSNYNSNSTYYQINSNSSGCNNITSTSTGVKYVATSDAVANSVTYQQVVAQIINQIMSKQSNKAEGGLFTDNENNLAAAIGNLVMTKLDQTTMAEIGNVANISTTTVQICVDSTGGNNIFFSSQIDIFNYYNSVYSASATVQSVAADISNMLSADQSNKSTGILAMIIRAIIVIAIVIILVIGGAIGLYVLTMFG